MSSFFPSLIKPRFRLQLHPKIDSLTVFDRFRRCASFAPAAEIASDRIKSCALFDTSTTRFWSKRKRRKPIFLKAFAEQEVDEFEIRKSSMDVEAEIYEFMQNSAKPSSFPTKQELIAAGRADLVECVMALGGWLAYGWDINDNDSIARKLNIQSNGGNTISESSESETCISQNDHIIEANTKLKGVNGTKGALPDTWRSWSLQRANFSLTNFEAGEIVPNDYARLSEDHPLDVEVSDKKFLQQAQNSTSYYGTDEKAVNESKIHSPLHLEVDLYSAAHILEARVNDATSQKQNSLYEQHILSDALEFQETELIKARHMLKSIRTNSKILQGKFSLEIREAQKILEMKQSKLTVVEQPLSLIRATDIIWSNSASEILLAGSFDGWTSKRKMKRSNSNTFSLQLKLYPGRFEIKFIVDGVWKVDPLRPTVNNNGYTNNLLVIE